MTRMMSAKLRRRSIREMRSAVALSATISSRWVAASAIADRRAKQRGDSASPEPPLPRTAHVIATLKRPEEVECLRRIYGTGFFLIGFSGTREDREQYLTERGNDIQDIPALIETDAAQDAEHGQRTRDTFQLADVFMSIGNYPSETPRFLDLIFGDPRITPTAEEHAMFLAYAASLRSGDLARQVGAAIVDEHGDLLSVGWNESPRPGGGLYGPEANNCRDLKLGEDSNEKEKNAIAERIAGGLHESGSSIDRIVLQKILKKSGLFDITEFGRSVHAEMEALLACARSGKSARNSTIFTTTFPCHNCTRHIVASGIRKVVYIEPYAKSKAPALHKDEISIDREEEGRVPFMPFVGIGPRRYFDLFSLKLSTGYPVERKKDGRVVEWKRSKAPVRLQLQPTSYLDGSCWRGPNFRKH
jgi:deoxycytidylate deaminase